MASVAQIQANRLNAQKSTGPCTAEGKEKASQNSLKHGLLAREAVVAGEDPEEFECYREGMLEELAPAGAVETMLAERVVGLSWRLRRAQRLQNAAFAALDEGEPTPLLEARLEEWKQLKGSEWDRGISGMVDENAALGRVVVADFAEARVLDRLLMYERRIESSLYRTMAELRHERQARAAATGPEEVSHAEGGLPAGQESATLAKLASFGTDVVRSHGQDAHATETPDGVTTNATEMPAGVVRGTGIPSASLSGQAPPVAGNHGQDAHATGTPHAGESHGRPRPEGPLRGRHATETPYGVTANAIAGVPVEEQSCETKPISPNPDESQSGSGKEVRSDSCQDAYAQTG